MVPIAGAVNELLDAAQADRNDRQEPTAGSEAMEDVSQQDRFAFPDTTTEDGSNEGVIDVGRAMASLNLSVGEDHTRAFASMILDTERTFVWSLPVLGRAAVEAFGSARHLAERGIGTRRRAGRVVNEMIYSAANVDRLPSEARGQEKRMKNRVDQALAMGLKKMPSTRNKPPSFEEQRPGLAEIVSRLYAPDRLGKVVYNYWSAVSHATQWGLYQSFGEPVDEGPLGALKAPVVLTVDAVWTIALLLVLAHLETLEHYMQWNGWDAPTYADAMKRHRPAFDEWVGRHADRTAMDPMLLPASALSLARTFLWLPPGVTTA